MIATLKTITKACRPMIQDASPLPDRAAYVAWRALWRQQYAALSEAIRAEKLVVKSLSRAGEYAGISQSELDIGRYYAAAMLTRRADEKAIAIARYREQQRLRQTLQTN